MGPAQKIEQLVAEAAFSVLPEFRITNELKVTPSHHAECVTSS
jgi:hypothetical protein